VRVLFAVPSADEQKQIVKSFQMLEDTQEMALSKKSTLQDIFRTLLHELMTATTLVHSITLPK